MLLRTETYTENEVEMLKSYYGYIDENGNEVVKGTYSRPKERPVVEPSAPKPSQLDRMEEMLQKSHEEIKNEAIDEYTAMLMEEGVL